MGPSVLTIDKERLNNVTYRKLSAGATMGLTCCLFGQQTGKRAWERFQLQTSHRMRF